VQASNHNPLLDNLL